MPIDDNNPNSLTISKSVRSVAVAFVLLAGAPACCGRKVTFRPRIRRQRMIVPAPYRPSLREGSPPVGFDASGVPTWLEGTPSAPPPSWRVRSDGPARCPGRWSRPPGGPPSHPAPLWPRPCRCRQRGRRIHACTKTEGFYPCPSHKTHSSSNRALAKHGLRQVWTSATHWRCRP
jgi:hypothetical protein